MAARGNDKWTAEVDGPMQPLLAEALAVEAGTSIEALREATDETDRRHAKARLALARCLLRELDSDDAPIRLTAPVHFISDVLRDATTEAVHSLYLVAESISEDRTAMTETAVTELRSRLAAVTSVAGALIAAEAHRRLGVAGEEAAS